MKKNASPIKYLWVVLSILFCILSAQVTLAQRSITLLSPNGGEVWTVGTIQEITWSATGIDTVKIEYSIYGPGGPWELVGIASNPLPSGDKLDLETKFGEFNWLIALNWTSSSCRVRVSQNSNPSVMDMSDFAFTIYLPQQFTIWRQQTSGTTRALNSVKSVDQFVGWIGGNSGTVLRTTNRGTTWNSVGGNRIGNADIYAIEAVDANRAFVATGPNATYIIRTTNGGNTWDTVFTHASSFIDAIKMFDANNGIAIGDPVTGYWLIKRTTDGGNTWVNGQQPPLALADEFGWTNGMASLNVYVWFGSSRGRIYRSTNYGATWYPTPTTLPDTPAVTAIYFNSFNNGLSGTQRGSLYKSTDAGATWTRSLQTLPHAVWGISGNPGTQNYWAISGRNIYATTNSGMSWDSTRMGYIGLSTWNHISMVGSLFPSGWAVSANGSIVNYAPIIENNPNENHSPTQDYALSQSYPNPFNPETRIQFDVQKEGFVTLRVYNLLGEEVSTLVNEEKPPGTYDVAWRADSGLASGVYFCRFTVGGFVQTRKLLLLR